MPRKRPAVAITPGLKPGVNRIKIKGALHVYRRQSDGQMIARSWPRGNGGNTPARLAAQQLFKDMVKAAKFATGAQQQAARAAAAKTTFLARDILEMAATGRLSFIEFDDGSLQMGWRVADQMIQVLLDSIFNAPGSMIVRGPDYWLALLAGTDGQVLTFDSAAGIPQWKSSTADIQTLLDQISTTPGMGIVRGASDWEAIDLSNVGDIQQLLDQLSPSSGDGVRFNGTDWVVVDFGTVYDALGAADAAQTAAEAYADSLQGNGIAAFHPGYIAGRLYSTPTAGAASSVASFTGTIYAVPFFVPKQTTFTTVTARIAISGSATKVQCAVYDNAGPGPKNLEYSTEVTGLTGTGDFSKTGLSWTLSVGWHWLAFSPNATTSFQANAANGETTQLCGASGTNTLLSGFSGTWVYSSVSPPNPFPTFSGNTGATPVFWLSK